MAIFPSNETAILATDSGTLAMGLSALLLTIPPIHKVTTVDSIDSLISNLDSLHPVLILIDTALMDEQRQDRIEAIGNLAPKSLRVLLTEDMAEFREMVYYTQDTVVIKGADPARLARTLEYLLRDRLAA